MKVDDNYPNHEKFLLGFFFGSVTCEQPRKRVPLDRASPLETFRSGDDKIHARTTRFFFKKASALIPTPQISTPRLTSPFAALSAGERRERSNFHQTHAQTVTAA